GLELGTVNSAHHQSVDKPGDLLKISAYSDPSIVEAMEWKDPLNKSWLLMVQWHPERMTDPSSPFSAAVKTAFLDACL
ncbi:MAG TPA: gamma-glutamyl-gamma-aminobutyrate hydrolase family protein, partial [Puia sp.]|nr:gamma-glutamyl-gamma-aminobutyrate hydrolase family protein [Puia sp.]